MNLGAALALSLLLFAPGFAAFVRLFHGFRVQGAYPAPPAPGSMLALAVVSLGAIVAHALGALLLAVNAWLVSRNHVVFDIGATPDIYAMLFGSTNGISGLDATAVASILLFILLLSGAAYGLTDLLIKRGMKRKWLEPLLYGWTAPIFLSATGNNRFVTGFVLTATGHDGRYLAYEGSVENLSLNSDKEVQSVTLTDCSRFMVSIGREGIVRRATDNRDVIPRMVIGAADIRNIAFEVVEVAAD